MEQGGDLGAEVLDFGGPGCVVGLGLGLDDVLVYATY